MATKQKGDIAEQAVILRALQKGWGVLIPVGDRLPYDLVFDLDGDLLKIQVKSGWYDIRKNNFVVDNRRIKTNRRHIKRENYKVGDFDFAIIFLEEIDVFYVMPFDVFSGYGSEIHFVESSKRQRKPKSAEFREAWELIGRKASL